MEDLKKSLDNFEQWPIPFHEPDLDNQMTAFAVYESDHVSAMELLEDLPLV